MSILANLMKAQISTVVALVKLKQSKFVHRKRFFIKILFKKNRVGNVNECQLNHHEI